MNERKQQMSNNSCVDRGLLVSLRDGELSTDESARVLAHIAECPDCAADQRAVTAGSHEIYDLFATLDAPSQEMPDTATALAAMQAKLHIKGKKSISAEQLQPLATNRPIPFVQGNKRRRYGWIITAVAAALIALLVLPNASVLASQFLALFRVQQFQPVTVNPQGLTRDLYSGLRDFGDMQINFDRATDIQNATQQEAKQYVHFPLLLPSQFPQGVGQTPHFTLIANGQGTFTFDASKVQTYLAQTGQSNIRIPANLNGATYTIDSQPGMIVSYATNCQLVKKVSHSVEKTAAKCSGGNPFFVAEIPSPVVQATGKASIKDLTDFLLSLPKLSPSLRALLQNLDLQKGIVPLPVPAEVHAQQTTVHGTAGLLLVDTAMKLGATLWQKDGIIYMVASVTNNNGAELLTSANSLH